MKKSVIAVILCAVVIVIAAVVFISGSKTKSVKKSIESALSNSTIVESYSIGDISYKEDLIIDNLFIKWSSGEETSFKKIKVNNFDLDKLSGSSMELNGIKLEDDNNLHISLDIKDGYSDNVSFEDTGRMLAELKSFNYFIPFYSYENLKYNDLSMAEFGRDEFIHADNTTVFAKVTAGRYPEKSRVEVRNVSVSNSGGMPVTISQIIFNDRYDKDAGTYSFNMEPALISDVLAFDFDVDLVDVDLEEQMLGFADNNPAKIEDFRIKIVDHGFVEMFSSMMMLYSGAASGEDAEALLNNSKKEFLKELFDDPDFKALDNKEALKDVLTELVNNPKSFEFFFNPISPISPNDIDTENGFDSIKDYNISISVNGGNAVEVY